MSGKSLAIQGVIETIISVAFIAAYLYCHNTDYLVVGSIFRLLNIQTQLFIIMHKLDK